MRIDAHLWGRLAAAIVLAWPSLVLAGTFLYLERVPDIGSVPPRGLVASPEGAFTGTAHDSPFFGWRGVGIDVQISCSSQPCRPGSWSLFFGAPAGQPLVAGVYEHATVDYGQLSLPRFDIVWNSSRCFVTGGRFVVRELERDAAGALASFAADFEQSCEGTNERYVGAIRFHAGDAACAAGEAGGCDDHDPCTAGDRCQAGRCEGDPGPGTCSLITCADANPCTDDAVDASGHCQHTAIAGTCWDLSGKSTLYVTALGRTCSCGLPRSQGVLALRADGMFAAPGGELDADTCPSRIAVGVPDEVGTWRRKRRRFVLDTTNLPDLLDAAGQCAGSSDVRVRGYHTQVRVSADGARLTGTQVMRGRVAGVPAAIRIVARLRGVPGTGANPAASPSAARIALAAKQCERRLTACFRR